MERPPDNTHTHVLTNFTPMLIAWCWTFVLNRQQWRSRDKPQRSKPTGSGTTTNCCSRRHGCCVVTWGKLLLYTRTRYLTASRKKSRPQAAEQLAANTLGEVEGLFSLLADCVLSPPVDGLLQCAVCGLWFYLPVFTFIHTITGGHNR